MRDGEGEAELRLRHAACEVTQKMHTQGGGKRAASSWQPEVEKRDLLMVIRCFMTLRGVLPFAPAPAKLRVDITAEGRPAVARVYITDESGNPHRMSGVVACARRDELHSIVDKSAKAIFPPGKYKVRAEKGAEYGAAEKK